MVSIKKASETAEVTTFRNISDVEKISVDIELFDGKGEGKDGEFTYQFFKDADGSEVRVPVTVLVQLRAQIEANPKLKFFAVSKKGEGKNGTSYTVIPKLE